MSAPLLAVTGLAAGYGGVMALHRVDLTVEPGEAVALLGANGAGKTTLMKAIIGLVGPSAGRLQLDGSDLAALPAHRRARLGIGYCPEGRRTFPGLSVWENLVIASWEPAPARGRRLAGMFQMFPALAERRDSPAWQLSGGQQQMLAIGRALMSRPRLLLLDEPSLGLSPRLTEEVMGRIPEIVATGTAVLLAEQNAAMALEVCSRATVLKTGRVTRSGPAAELAASPEIRAAFLGG